MSKLLTVLYEVAEIRAACQHVHDERFGLSPRSVLRAVLGRSPGDSSMQCAELQRLRARLEEGSRRLDALDEEDLAIRRGQEIYETLREYVGALAGSLASLEQLCNHDHAMSTAPAGDDLAPLKVAYDDALGHQKQLAMRLNALIAGL